MLQFKTQKSKKYLSNAMWPLIEKIIRLFLGFFVGTLVVRHLGPEKFGQLSYVQSIVALVSVFISFGMDEVASRDLVIHKNTSKENEILGTYSSIRLLATFSVTFIIIVSCSLLYNTGNLEYNLYLLFIILTLQFVFQLSQTFTLFYQANIQNKILVQSNLISLTICSILRLALIFIVFTKKVEWFALVITFEFLINAALLVRSYGLEHIKKWRLNKGYAKNILNESFPYILSGIFISLYMRIDQLMIEYFLNSTELGYYSAAIRLSEVFYFIPGAIAVSLFPSIMESINDKNAYLKKFQSLYGLLTAMAILIAISFTVLSPFLINLLYGSSFSPASSILIVHIWASIFVFYGVAKSKWIVSQKLQKINLFYVISGAIINFALNLIFIPKYGVIGAALTTLISQAFITIIIPTFIKHDRVSVKMFFSSFNIINTYKYIRSKI